jgi:hypothetical protein
MTFIQNVIIFKFNSRLITHLQQQKKTRILKYTTLSILLKDYLLNNIKF